MDQETQKIIQDQMKTLPSDVKEAIVSVDYRTKMQEIAQRQKLLIDQAGKLEMETTLVMIGLEPLTDYIANIGRELGVDAERATEIAKDVSESIFKPIRGSLKTMNEVQEPAPEEEPDTYSGWGDTKNTGASAEPNSTSDLNRDQILSEIENPLPNRSEPTPTVSGETKIPISTNKEIEIRPDISPIEAKMTGTTVSAQQIVNAKPEIKLPAVEKTPISKVDPYREPLN